VDLFGSGYEPMSGFCKRGNEHSGSSATLLVS
jgi:hypothetical protein